MEYWSTWVYEHNIISAPLSNCASILTVLSVSYSFFLRTDNERIKLVYKYPVFVLFNRRKYLDTEFEKILYV